MVAAKWRTSTLVIIVGLLKDGAELAVATLVTFLESLGSLDEIEVLLRQFLLAFDRRQVNAFGCCTRLAIALLLFDELLNGVHFIVTFL